jgi:uncharacterized membrane protein
MEKMIVVVFDNEAKALDGLQVIRELDSDGEISVHQAQVVAKDPGGAVRVINNDDLLSLPMVAGGTAVGALVGLLGGPIGALVGATAGAVLGSIGDMEQSGVTDEFVADVSTALTPGKVAVVADIMEERVTPLDIRMEEIGGVVFRRMRTFVETTQSDLDAAAHQTEIDQLKSERAQARADRLAKIDARIDHLRARLQYAIERKRAAMEARQRQREDRIEALQEKAKRSDGEIRRRQEARISALRRDYAERVAAG